MGGNFCIDLYDLEKGHTPLAGSKAVKLGELSKLHILVPSGFCVVSTAYCQHLLDNNINPNTEHLVDSNTDLVRDHLLSLRNAICESPILPTLKQELADSYQGGTVAVRSSATAEDLPEASFAGQYDTILNVASLEACYMALKRCWASLWTERAYHYRVQNGIDHQNVSMAVIVQQQVDADMAGVAFSIDPVSGSHLRIVIEACHGLGENLVSGRVTPERWVWRKQNLTLLKKEPLEGTDLDRRVAKRLARRVRRLEKHFGCPQDVEWAVKDGRLHFLQTRPITAIPAPKNLGEQQIWTNFIFGEVLPDVTTPMTWSLIEHMLTPLFSSVFTLFGADVTRAPILGLVAGRVYFNLTTLVAASAPFAWLLRRNPLTSDQLTMAVGGHQGDFDIPEEILPDMGFSWLKCLGSIPHNLWMIYRHRSQQATVFLERFKERNEELLCLDPTQLDTSMLGRTFCQIIATDLQQWNLLYLSGAGWSLPVLEKICRVWLGEEDQELLHRLFAGQGGMDNTEAGLELWRLAQEARQDPTTEQALLSGEAWETIQSDLAPGFLQAWERFMTEHGHHCRGEMDIYNVRWYEQPDYILQIVRGYLQVSTEIDPLARQERLNVECNNLVTQCRCRLRNPLKRWLFNRALRSARQLTCDRENWKNQAIRWITTLRRILQVLGDRLTKQGIFTVPDDIFFLTINELQPVTDRTADFDVKDRIAQRRAEYNWNQDQNPTPVVVGPFDPDKHTSRPVDGNMRELKGLGVSPGIVTGPARVILHADNHQTIMPGEILVAPFTDPAWTPYFIPAAGVVMDLGGALSHGSIIAREYGLPAVVNLGCATQVIRTGQMIEVNGREGIVRIIG